MTTFKHFNKFASKLSPEKVLAIRERWARREASQIAMAQEYRVSIGTIRNVVKGVTWQDMPMVESEDEVEAQIAKSQRVLATLLTAPTPEKDEAPPEPVMPWDKPGDPLARFRKPSDPPVGGAVPQVDREETRTHDDDQD